MSEQHAKTPWDFRISHYEEEAFDITAPGVGALALVKSKADAHRIVASVNRLAHFSVEQIENHAVDTRTHIDLVCENHRLISQRDHLLAALKRIAAEKPYLMHDAKQHEFLCYTNGFNPCKEAREAVEAIEAAEGKG